MATRTIEVRECDRCGKDRAQTWVITGPEGGTREIELCDRHSAAVANAFALGRAMTAPTRTKPVIPRRRRPDPPAPAPPPSPTPAAPPTLPPALKSAEPQWR